ncbi:MAG: prolyl oligopeptidase family serine peptidase [Bacteroidota bacterium]
MKKLAFVVLLLFITTFSLFAQEDTYQWLEEVDGKKALEFVEKQNKTSLDVLTKHKDYQDIYDKSLAVLNATDRIAFPTIYGDYIYNFWQDKEHERGIWRRTSTEKYNSGKPEWETVLDIDAMSKKDNIKWVFKGANGLYPKYNRFMVRLSKGGGDAVVIKEFDATTKSFLTDGFSMDEAKGNAGYWDENTLIVSSDFGPGTMTSSGYARQVKLWKRGTLLKDAQLIFEGETSDVASGGSTFRDGDKKYLVVNRNPTFYTSKTFVWQNNKLIPIAIPEDADSGGLLNNQLVINLKSDWTVNGTTYKQGSVISTNFTSLLEGKTNIIKLFEPDAYSSVSGISTTKNFLLFNVLNNVKSELYTYAFKNGSWEKTKVAAPDFGTIGISDTDEFSDNYFFTFQNFLTPTSLYAANAKTNTLKVVKTLPFYFDSSKYKVDQYKATSKDGEKIPYFVISSKNIVLDGTNPTLLNAYGGFESSQLPFYSGVIGQGWLEKGGVFVLANIRGGGEFGPKWHQAGLKEKRQNIYNDFHAVAEDVIAKKITSNKHLGIQGGSNGGLLVGVAFTQRPDLYNAVVCQVPLLDMKRYNKLLAGASWMGEYGNPDIPAEWDYIQKYSPYQNLNKDAKYPEVFFMTSTRDDRVHPGHARKMAAKMIDMGHKIYYYENTEGGHGGSSTNAQRAKFVALYYSYLLMKLKS